MRLNRTRAAFTLVELLVTMALLAMVLAAILMGHWAGMRMFAALRAGLGDTDELRAALGMMTSDFRSAREIQVGEGDAQVFTNAIWGSRQEGRAVQLCSGTNPAELVRYYYDADQRGLIRATPGSADARIVLRGLRQSPVFRLESAAGIVLSNGCRQAAIALQGELEAGDPGRAGMISTGWFLPQPLRLRVTPRPAD